MNNKINKLLMMLACGLTMQAHAANNVLIEADSASSSARKYGLGCNWRTADDLKTIRALGVNHLDKRNKIIKILSAVSKSTPSVDFSSGFPPVFDQGNLGSCTSNATVGAVLYELIKQGNAVAANCVETGANGKPGSDMLSRLFHYYQERLLLGTVGQDSGASLVNAIQVLKNKGICHDSYWPYDISKFAAPPAAVVNGKTDASSYEIATVVPPSASYKFIPTTTVTQNLSVIKALLAANTPVMIGIEVYDTFQSAPRGAVPMPSRRDIFLGGHAVLLCGYADTNKAGTSGTFKFRNSWGTGWGNNGYGTLPYNYITSSYTHELYQVGTITAPHTVAAGSVASTLAAAIKSPAAGIDQTTSTPVSTVNSKKQKSRASHNDFDDNAVLIQAYKNKKRRYH